MTSATRPTAHAAEAREAALREILDVLNRSRDDEGPVFDAILAKAAGLCGAEAAGLYLLDADGGSLTLVRNLGDETEMFGHGRRIELDAPLFMAVAIRRAEVVAIADLKETELYRSGDETLRRFVDEEGVRSRLVVPLLDKGEAAGCIALSRREVKPFAPDEVALIEAFAAQAVIAIENVRQFRELQTRLEREAATREILQVISRSRDDEQPVFDAILANACRLCDAPLAYLVMGDGEGRVRCLARRGAFVKFGETLDQLSVAVDSRLALVRAFVEGRTIRVDDIADDDLYRDGEPNRVSMVEDEGARSILVVPLMQGREGLGSITLYRREVRPFTEADAALIEAFAAQAVIAVENVRQFRELQTRLERETATGEILDVVSRSQDDAAPAFETVLRSARRLCGAVSAALLLGRAGDATLTLAALDDDEVTQASSADAILAEVNATPLPMDPALHLAARAILEGEMQQVDDLADTDAYRAGERTRRIMVDEQGLRTALCVPLFVRGETVGAINLHRRERRPFAPEEIALARTFAAQASIAVENARSFAELQKRLEREAATRDILEVIARSRDDETPVFDAILEAASRLLKAKLAFLTLADETRTNVLVPAHRGTTPEFGAILDDFAEPIDRSELVAVRPVATGEVIRIDDMKDTDLYRSGEPRRLQMVDVEGVRSVVGVPLLKDGVGLGALVLYRRDVAPFSDDDVALLQSFAAQAVIAIDNVRQFREVRERLEREQATAEVLEVISRSRDDEQPVFEAILQRAARLCDAQGAGLHMLDEQAGALRLMCNWGVARGIFNPGFEMPLDGPMLLPTAVRERRVASVADLRDTEAYRSGDPGRVRLADEEGVRSWLIVPMVRNDEGMGALTLSRHEVKPFSDDEIALVETFAAQAVIAIENVRQFRQVQERLERERATSHVLSVISRSRDDETPVFDAILERAARLCRAPSANLLMVDEARQNVVLAAALGSERQAKIGETHPLATEHTPSLAIRGGAPVQIPDMKDTDLYRDGDPIRRQLVDAAGLRTSLAVPLIKSGEAIGAIVVLRFGEPAPFSDADVALLETFAAQAVIAIENVRQFKALESLNAELGERVEEQVGEIERMGRLKRFLSPAVAQAITSTGSEAKLSSHRALVAVLFADIRGFTAFCETAEPEETIEVLQTYHEEMGRLLHEHGAGVDHRSGDGIMAIFNDPLPCDDPAGDAVRLAVAMRARMQELCRGWRKLGHRLGFGVGVSLGYATVGMVGSEGRYDYTASGTAVNLGARLCDRAADGEILLSPRAAIAVEEDFSTEPVGEIDFKGLREPVEVFRLAGGPRPEA